MVETVPFIPENAPFTAEQRAWLNGLLAGLFSTSALPAAAPAKPSHRIAVLYASQSGTAEGLARKLAKELKAQGHVPAVSTLVGYTPAALAAEKYALILASTYGDGDAPDGVQPFYEQLCSGTLSPLRRSLLRGPGAGGQTLRAFLQIRQAIWTRNSLRWGQTRSASGWIATWTWTSRLSGGSLR